MRPTAVPAGSRMSSWSAMQFFFNAVEVADQTETGFFLPPLEGPPLMAPLDVTHREMRCWRAGFGAGLVQGHQHAPGVRLL